MKYTVHNFRWRYFATLLGLYMLPYLSWGQQIEKIFYSNKGKKTNEVFADWYRVVSIPQEEGDEKIFRDFYMSGEVKGEGHYLTLDEANANNTVLDGECIFYNKAGKILKHFVMRNGSYDGAYVEFNDERTEFVEMEFVMGVHKYDWYYKANANGAYGRFYFSDDSLVPEEMSPGDHIVNWVDGVPWVSFNCNGLTVSMSVESIREYGKYYQATIIIDNHSFEPLLIEPSENFYALSAAKDVDLILFPESSELLSYDEYMRIVRTHQGWQEAAITLANVAVAVSNSLSSNSASVSVNGSTAYVSARGNSVNVFVPDMMWAGVRDEWKRDRAVIDRGYFKKNTINPGEQVSGFFNIKRKRNKSLCVICELNNMTIPFYWDVSEEIAVPLNYDDIVENIRYELYENNAFSWLATTNNMDVLELTYEENKTLIKIDGYTDNDSILVEDANGEHEVKLYYTQGQYNYAKNAYEQGGLQIVVDSRVSCPFSIINKTNPFRCVKDVRVKEE